MTHSDHSHSPTPHGVVQGQFQAQTQTRMPGAQEHVQVQETTAHARAHIQDLAEKKEETAVSTTSADAAAQATRAEAEVEAAAVAAPASSPAPGVPPGDGDSPSDTDRDQWRLRRHRSLDRLSVGRHAADAEALARLQLSRAGAGVVLGTDQSGAPLALPLFRPEPVRIVLIGHPTLAHYVARQALRFGARVMAWSQQPTQWAQLGVAVTGRTDRVAALVPGEPSTLTATASAPVLRIHDTGQRHQDETLPAWYTCLELVNSPQHTTPQALVDADIVMTQCLDHNAANFLLAARSLPRIAIAQLTQLQSDMFALFESGICHYLWMTSPHARVESG